MKTVFHLIERGFKYIEREGKLPSLPEVKSAMRTLIKKEKMPLPTFIQLEPTTKCNYKCIMCSRSSLSPSRLNRDMSLSEFKFIIDQIPSLKSVHLQGLGEPISNWRSS